MECTLSADTTHPSGVLAYPTFDYMLELDEARRFWSCLAFDLSNMYLMGYLVIFYINFGHDSSARFTTWSLWIGAIRRIGLQTGLA